MMILLLSKGVFIITILADDQIAEQLRTVRCFLLDMDGTFYLGDKLLEGSLAFLQALGKTGRQSLFVTNNSSKSADAYIEKLRRMGVRDPFLRVLTSGEAAGQYALKHFPGQSVYLLGNEALRGELSAMGVPLADDKPDIVLVGFDTTLTYDTLARTCDYLRAGLPYIATHPDFNCPTESGFIPDIGAIIAFIAASTGRQPDVIIGKPHRSIVDCALSRTGCSAAECAMVGDRLYTDIATGVNFGMTSILVLTGETARADISASPVQPHLVFDTLSDMIPYLT